MDFPSDGYDLDHMHAHATSIEKGLAELLPVSLHASCATSNHEKGERLFATGARPVCMFFVADGEVVLERMGSQGESIILQRTRHGFVGEASLQSERYHCDGRVTAPARISRVPIRALSAALACDAQFAIRWIGMLNREVKRLRLQCERLSLNKVQDRLLHLLETEGTQGRFPVGSGLKSLARELGVSHEALYRCVSEMEKNHALGRDGGFLRLLPAV